MVTTIQNRRDNEFNWANINPVLYDGEIGIETDTGKVKIGDGTKNWNTLQYFTTNIVKQPSTAQTLQEDENNYILPDTSGVLFVKSNKNSTITGIVPPTTKPNGFTLKIVNIGKKVVKFKPEKTQSSPSNRLLGSGGKGKGKQIKANKAEAFMVIYSDEKNRWVKFSD